MINIFGTSYRLHPLFVLMMAASIVTGYGIEMAVLFVIVLIHELGHVVCARGFGWRVSRVELYPFGGAAVTEDAGGSPAWQELAVALAGPLQHAWMVLFALLMHQFGWWGTAWSVYFIQANVMIGLFNLLPVHPLDGGRVLQALLSYVLPYHSVMVIVSRTSLVLSIGLAICSLAVPLWNGVQLNLLLIGAFLVYSNWVAQRNIMYEFIRFLVKRDERMAVLIRGGAHAHPLIVTRERLIRSVLRMYMRDRLHLIYVLDERGRIEAVLPEQRVTRGFFTKNSAECAVSDLFM
ncbi:M50 family metallopeptidase [Paenibacillus sp. y28]|uniref:M50 family metallopeptidase n=1 Tax=Paenibacillus sp. y28 TaxID=3129110 RepID=UPI003016B772